MSKSTKVLVIHPKDSTTDFLCQATGFDFTVIRTNLGDSTLKKLIRQHDVIVMMGHGDQGGLYGFDKYVIDSSFVSELRKKICICIWCYASDFVQKYHLSTPFSTGMFISELEEAQYLGITTTSIEILNSNYRFISGLGTMLSILASETEFPKYWIEKINNSYANPELEDVVEPRKYNSEQFYSNIYNI